MCDVNITKSMDHFVRYTSASHNGEKGMALTNNIEFDTTPEVGETFPCLIEQTDIPLSVSAAFS